MDFILQKILVFFCIYGVAGLFLLYNGYVSRTRIEKVASGAMLIAFASFLLSAIAIVSTPLDYLAANTHTLSCVRDQIEPFIPIVVFLSGIFTFLFGGVGTNLISSGVIRSDNQEIMDLLIRLESRVDTIEQQVNRPPITHIRRLISSAVVMFLAVGIIFFWLLN